MVTQIDDNIALRLLYDVRLREINVIWLWTPWKKLYKNFRRVECTCIDIKIRYWPWFVLWKVQWSTVLCCTYCAILYCTVPYRIVPYHTVLCCTYCTAMYCRITSADFIILSHPSHTHKLTSPSWRVHQHHINRVDNPACYMVSNSLAGILTDAVSMGTGLV